MTSGAVILVEVGFKTFVSKRQRSTTINSEYLNPLKLYTEETYFFAYIKQVWADIAYLRRGKISDTELLGPIFAVSQGFLQTLGSFYLIQNIIGSEMYLAKERQLLTSVNFANCYKHPKTECGLIGCLNFVIRLSGAAAALLLPVYT
ncbi:hypothetical protein [Leptothoe sp. PORK10 BA2]|uniref:hypothetical protein n=1 Tax=Leptothoe sp. PORK10 BA2 TaxID=3110254 RepID=UPI002B22073A|nr:hypothetical protein [Leptothoe sp. PORK10 BA2]MEA5466196.1 hypothetical protein [Leptothoe sp. PORK10 BA2]